MNTYNSWTGKEIIKGKSVHFLILTIIFAVLLNKVAEKGLSYLMNAGNPSIYTYNYSIGAIGIIFVIPAAFFSIWALKGLLKSKEIFLQSSIVDKIKFSKYLQIAKIGSEKGFSLLLILLNLIRILGKAMLYIILGVLFLMFMLLGSSSGSGSRTSSSGGAISRSPNHLNDRRKLKEGAEWEAKQKQKEASVSKKHALNQARYNINTHYFDERRNRANVKQREANEAAKRARNL